MLEPLARTIHALRRASRNADIGVMVGGQVFNEHPEYVALVGADTTAADARQAALQAEMREGVPRIRTAFWLAHRAFNSQVRLVETHAAAIPAALPVFDVVVVGNVLQHLRFPVDVLLDLATRADTVVVTEADWLGLDPRKPLMQLYTPQLRTGQLASWYQCSPQLVEDVLTLSGKRLVSRDWFSQPFAPSPGGPTTRARLFTITAQRQ